MSHDPIPASADATPADLMDLAERIAREAGQLVREATHGTVSVAATKSSGVDLVTEVDRAAEALIRRRLAEARPADAVLGEEEEAKLGTSGLTWVVDPIDGTTNFVYGLADYSVSIAVVSGEPDPDTWTLLASAVHAPATGRTWTAARGGGAFADGVALRLGEAAPLGRSLAGTGFAYTADRRAAQAQLLTVVLPEVRDIRRLGSAAIDLCLVAEGRLDFFYEQHLNPWDMAGGALVLAEAGGVVRRRGHGESALTVGGPSVTVEAFLALLDAHGIGDAG
ncbi:inositol monophosphatase family protein [Georgenia sp. MJ170]|uniref:inositol monophosphatase family protein n=1 Tax=Georgenia sunbinii TaxID=3117728 RepID=UPI002F267533